MTAMATGLTTVNFSLTNTSVASSAVWTITKTHTGNFSQGQNGATYTVTATNTGTGPTNGSVVTVTETAPAGLTLVLMAGTGWTCVANSCTRNDVLGNGNAYPAITVTMNVGAAAAASVINSVSVTGGGASLQTANDPTTINPVIDVTSQLNAVVSGLGRNRTTGLWSETLTVTNTSASTITGPVHVVLSALGANATLNNGTGVRNGSPYIDFAGPIAPGGSASVLLIFTNPTNGFITFTPLAFTGVF